MLFFSEEEQVKKGVPARLVKNIPTFQCAVLRQMGIDFFTQYLLGQRNMEDFHISLPCDSWLLLTSRHSHPFE